ncbi:oligogalacturonate-specific porin KdgM family protein [Vibrio amylolyticus]|uniref:oligogalacturonate-specific porin KdgM family protein n=1 Tax=Vibrio amylolyticus TaxID=2847292 RepID=UPI0035531F31
MKKIIPVSLLVLLPITATAGGYVDLRTEHRTTTDQYNSRFIIGNHFDNGYGLETLTNVRHAAGAYDETRVINTEFTHYYTHAINDNFVLNPGLVMNFQGSNTFFMPYLKLNYNFDNGFFVHGRYRYDFSTEALVNDYGNEETAKRHRYDIWTGYNTDSYQISYALTYFDQITHHTTELATGDLHAREHTVKAVYKWKPNIRPYAEVVDADTIASENDKTDWRFRLGVNFSF